MKVTLLSPTEIKEVETFGQITGYFSFLFGTEAGAMSHLPAAVLGLALCNALILFFIRRMRARASYGRPRHGEHHG